ncbi:ParA family protein [Leifsonia poae]|uniref:ParA family protein n=1 Tax=Leifsonia poae TaxID=110933 RepID=UPI001CBCD2A6|nr:ParA family protein [Leifsonia poae]
MRIVTVLNQKGGVGKSNVVMNLAAVVAADHSRVLVVDTDHLQRTASDWAETAEKNERPLPFDFTDEGDPALLGRLREAGAYDTIFVDTPGSLYESDLLGRFSTRRTSWCCRWSLSRLASNRSCARSNRSWSRAACRIAYC